MSKRSSGNLGLLAYGAIDTTTTGKEQWFASIEGPALCLYFEIAGPEITRKAWEFLTRKARRWIIRLAKDAAHPVQLVRDDEFVDRYFLLVGNHLPLVRLTLTGRSLKSLVQALRRVVEDLD